MAELEIRPSIKFIVLRYAVVAALELAAAIWYVADRGQLPLVALVVATLLYVWPIAAHIERQRTRCRLDSSHLRHEYGIFSTTVKTIPVAKIQDVTVRRTLNQRLWGIGNLRIETAGETSTVEIANVDDPEPTAQKILAAAAGATR